MAVPVGIAARIEMNNMIGIYAKENVSVVVKRKLNSILGTVGNVPFVEK